MEWSGTGRAQPVRNAAQGFSGEFLPASARMEWSAKVGLYQFTSAAIATSTASFAELGRERNGFFFQ